MDNILQEIIRDFISLPPEEIRRNNVILDSVLKTFIDKMKQQDPLFNRMYGGVFYGGSYYDGLRVGKPEEFDLDILLKIPKLSKPTLTTSNIPGFVHLQLPDLQAWMKQPEAMPDYRNFPKFLDSKGYLITDPVLQWMEGVVQKAANQLPMNGKKRILSNEKGNFGITIHKGGPALTLHISGSGMEMDVDLVACFVFTSDMWPKNGFKPNPVSNKSTFFIVPKKPKAPDNQPIPRYWRLSFQEQERVLIDNKNTLKPTVKLLKRLRDNLQHKCIASYYIKTVLLHEVDQRDNQFWRGPLSQVFMAVLKDYRAYIENKNLPYYWNKNNNLLRAIDAKTLDNMNNRLKAVIRDLETKPETIVEYFRDRDAKGGTSDTPQTDTSSSCIII